MNRIVLLACVVFFVASCLVAPVSARAQAGRDLAEFVQKYTADRGSVRSFYDWPWSEEALDRTDALLEEWEARLRAVDFQALDQQGRIDYVLMRTHLAAERAEQALTRARLAEMDALLPFRRLVIDLAMSRSRMAEPAPREWADRLSRVEAEIGEVRARIDAGRKKKEGEEPGDALFVSPVVAARAASATDALRRTLEDWFRYHDGYVPEFSWWVRKPHEQTAAAMADYAKHLREQVAGLKGKDDDPLIGDPIGREKLLADLATEFIPYSPEELIAIAEREFAWCEAEMLRASRELGFGDDWRGALEHVKNLHEPPGGQAALMADLARQGIDFVKEHDLVTVPELCEEAWRLTMLSPQGQRTLPFAAYNNQQILVAYPTDAMPHDDKLMSMRGNNRHFTRIVAAHELIPGHHLQGFVARRERPYRSLFRTPFLVEGWALHWEMLLWDKGFARGPEDRIGMLFWRMHRCARIIVSLKFHLGEMTTDEMIAFLVERVGHERLGATSEVRRYVGGDYGPLYQVAYMIGGLQLRALHEETVGRGRMTDREFHDVVLAHNAIPIELIRAGITGTSLDRESGSVWRFAG